MAIKWIKPLSTWLTAIGGLNWGLVGLFNFNVVQALFGTALVTTIIYSMVGIGALLFTLYEMKILK